MSIRESLRVLEESYMSPHASFSSRTQGRDKPELLCGMRPEYQRGRDRILYSKVLRRLEYKTQVFLAPRRDHYRTRLTHILGISQIARAIVKALRLNESLTEAIALGYDLGHTPFGHSGEYMLNRICEDGFARYRQNVRIVGILKKGGKGLDLIWEVRDGILNHRASGHPSTLEGTIVRLSDKIVYINRDIDDAIRVKMLMEDELPRGHTGILGYSVRERLSNMVHDIILNSIDKPAIIMSKDIEEAIQGLCRWMFEDVHKNEISKAEEDEVQNMIRQPYEYYTGHADKLPMKYALLTVNGGEKKSRVVCGYIAGISDICAID